MEVKDKGLRNFLFFFSVFPLLDDEIKMLAEDTDDLDETDASMFKDDDEKDDVQEKRGMKKKKSFLCEFTASNTTINARIVGWNRTC